MTEAVIMIAAAVLPALILWIYVCKRDTQREPLPQMLKALLYGMAISVPAVVIELGISDMLFGDNAPETLLETTTDAFFVAAIPEECLKLLALLLVLRNNPFFDEHYDGIVYAVCVSLGFATVENIGYIISETDGWLDLAISRALLAVPGHYAFAMLMGYYYSLWHFGDKSRKNLVCILLAPILAHGIYDSIAMSADVSPEFGGASAILLIYFCVKMHKFAHKKMTTHIINDLVKKEY